MIAWIIALLVVGFVIGFWAGKKYFGMRADEELTTEECVERLKERGYGVHLYKQNAPEKRGFK